MFLGKEATVCQATHVSCSYVLHALGISCTIVAVIRFQLELFPIRQAEWASNAQENEEASMQ